MSFRVIACLTVLTVMAGTQYTFAQGNDTSACISRTCCCDKDDSPAGVMISHLHAKNEWMFSAKWMNMNMGGMLSGSETVSEDAVFNQYLMSPKTMQMNMFMLMGMYGITNRLTGMVMVNYNTNTMQMNMFAPGGHHHPGSEQSSANHTMQSSGLGDTKLSVIYGIKNTRRHQLMVSGGVSLPTGSITKKGESTDMMYPNTRLPYAMQLGSGTVDLLPFAAYKYTHTKWSFSTQLSAVIRAGENTVGYRLGNEYVSNSWAAYRWLPFLSSSLRLEGSVTESISGGDPTLYQYAEPAANTANYGGTKATGYVGTSVFPLKGALQTLGIAAEYGVPFYQNVNGIQMKQQQFVNVSLSYGF